VVSEVATPLPPIEDAELIADLALLVKRWIAESRSCLSDGQMRRVLGLADAATSESVAWLPAGGDRS